jgi:hypothetical protein
MRRLLIVCVAAALSPVLWASDFTGEFGGCAEGLVALSGRQYPLAPKISADYHGQLVSICKIPEGTHVAYALGTLNGVSTITSLVVTETSAELNELFPSR